MKSLGLLSQMTGRSIQWLMTGEEEPQTTGEPVIPLSILEAVKDKDTRQLLEKTVAVLQSLTSHSGALRSNIESFYEAVLDKRDKSAIQEQVGKQDQKINRLEEQLQQLLEGNRKTESS